MPRLNAIPVLDAGDSINRGLRGWWPLTESAGSAAADISPFSNTGVWNDTTRLARISSPVGKAFTSLNYAYFDAPKFYWPSGASVTVSFWANTSAFSSVFGLPTSSYAGCHILEGTNISWFYNGNSSGLIQASYSSYSGKWTHICLVNNGTNLKAIYLNGVMAASGSTVAAAPTGGSGISIGGWKQIGYGSVASMQNFRIWNRVLSSPEILRLYREPWSGTIPAVRVRAKLPTTNYTIAAQGISRAYGIGAATFARGYALAATGVQRRYSFGDAALTFTPAQTGDTHDGFKRRTRRERALDAAQERLREEWVADRNAVRLSLEAAMGMAVEAADEPPAEVLEAVQQAEAIIPTLRAPEPDRAALDRAAALVERLQAAVVEMERAERQRALDEDDEEVMMLLRAL